jgi:hypothetical protein
MLGVGTDVVDVAVTVVDNVGMNAKKKKGK